VLYLKLAIPGAQAYLGKKIQSQDSILSITKPTTSAVLPVHPPPTAVFHCQQSLEYSTARKYEKSRIVSTRPAEY
jgi:hypothetical protein